MHKPQAPGTAIRSFVRRQGRMTVAQSRALETLWPRLGLETTGRLDFEAVFGRHAPRALEIGFGDGHALASLARAQPEQDFIGIEVHRPGIGHLLLEAERDGLNNLRVICADAVEVLTRQIPDASLQRILIWFPDPWPKKRHHKRRLLQAANATLLATKLEPGGILHLATDWENYAEQMREVLNATPGLRNMAADGGFSPKPDYRPETKFERRGRRLGHAVYDLLYERAG